LDWLTGSQEQLLGGNEDERSECNHGPGEFDRYGEISAATLLTRSQEFSRSAWS
jgi:hypothetical protein